MIRKLACASLVIAVAALSASAQPATKAPLGTWVREVGGNKVEFKFEAKTLSVQLMGGDKKISIDCDYGIAKDGTVFGRVHKLNSAEGPDPGHLFSFKAKAAKDELTISDLVGTDNAEARQLIEGTYKLQPKEK